MSHMFQVATDKHFSLTENENAETISWYTYIRYLYTEKKKLILPLYYIIFLFRNNLNIILLCFILCLQNVILFIFVMFTSQIPFKKIAEIYCN